MAGLPSRDELFPPLLQPARISWTPLILSIPLFGKTRVSSPKDTSQKAVLSSQIAAETLSSKCAVRDALLGFGFKLKGQGKPGLRPSQVAYGFRMSDGLKVPHLGEQRIIASVKKMVNDGLSYRKVCEFLTSVGVPTKNKGKSWQPEMIRRLLSR